MSLEGEQLGDFEILELLGKGGMGAVYKARQISLGRFVALKTLEASLANNPEYIERFRQESKAAAMLNHPNLVQVYSAGENEGLQWFAMEFVEGETARMRLRRKGRIDPLQALAIAIHVSMGLEHGWRKAGLIHRDIKPDNILLSSDGEVKLGDLGLAKSIEQASELTTSGASMGTPHFMSPEQIENMKDVDFRSDIYSLGCTLFYLLAGQPPYAGNSSASVFVQHITKHVPDLRSVWPQCPANLADTVRKMMQKKPEARQQTYEELVTSLRHAHDSLSNARRSRLPDIVDRPSVRVPEKEPAGKSNAFVAAVAGAAAIFAAGIVLLFSHLGRNSRSMEGTKPHEVPPSALKSGSAREQNMASHAAPLPDRAADPVRATEAVNRPSFAAATPAPPIPPVATTPSPPAPEISAPNSATTVALASTVATVPSTPVPVARIPLEAIAPAVPASTTKPEITPTKPPGAGDLDRSFGTDGKVITALSTEDNWASGVAVQEDGKILVAGTASDGTAWNLRVVRYHPDGKADCRFASTDDQIHMVAKAAGGLRASIAIQPDHKIVVTCACRIARYNSDGTLDLPFGKSGIVPFVPNSTDAVSIQPDGKIVVAGHWSTDGRNQFAIARYDPNGRPDLTFDGRGTVTTSFDSPADICECVTSQADGKIIAGGYTTLSNTRGRAFALVRYNHNGTLDKSFNGTGKVTTDLTEGGDEVKALTVQKDGKILAVGFSTGAVRCVALLRYNSDGSLDTTFNGTGKVMTNLGFLTIGYGVAVLPDGRIVVGGVANDGKTKILVVRYTPNGLLDTTFNESGTVATSIGVKGDSGSCLALQKDGKILVAGRTHNGRNNDSVLVRYLGGLAAPEKP